MLKIANQVILGLLVFAVMVSQPSAAVKVNGRTQTVVSQLLSNTEASALDELNSIINIDNDSQFSLNKFNEWLGNYMVDMFQEQSNEDTMYNVIDYKCTKNLESYSYQVSYDESDLSRVVNNKALCTLQETLTSGDLDTSAMLSSHMETTNRAVNNLFESRESYFSEMYSSMNTAMTQIESAEEIVSSLLNGMDSSEVLGAMIQLRANTKEIFLQSAESGEKINKGLALVQTLSGSSSLSSYDLVAVQEMLSEMKEDVVELIYSMQESEESESELLSTQQGLVSSLIDELNEENTSFEATLSSANACIELNESNEASLSETVQLEIQKLEDFQCLCEVLFERYSFISEKMSTQQYDLKDIQSYVEENSSVFE